MSTLKWITSILLVFLLGLPLCFAAEGGEFIDVHMHLDGVGDRQKPPPGLSYPTDRGMPTDRRPMNLGPSGKRDYSQAALLLVKKMDDYGVDKAVVMPPPQYAGKEGLYDFEELKNAVERHPDRLVLGAGGGSLNPMINGTDAGSVTEELRERFRAKASEIVAAGAKVFGEMTAMHVCMGPRHHYSAAPPDHPLFLLLADLAAQYDIPIDLHMEAIVKDIPTPQYLLDVCDKNPPTLPATIPAFERLLEHNPKARIVWQHIGWDNTGEMTTQLLRKMLVKHPNLYLAIKAIPNEAHKNSITNEDFHILPEWHALIEDFSDRFVVGADEFIAVPNITPQKPLSFRETWSTLDQLPPALLKKIARDNPKRIYKL